MTGPVRDRATFAALRRSGAVGRSGPLTIKFASGTVPPKVDGPTLRVAYSIGKRVGPAVERNRLRRRLREVVADEARAHNPALLPGAYLVIAGPKATDLSYGELRQGVERALEIIRTHRDRPDCGQE